MSKYRNEKQSASKIWVVISFLTVNKNFIKCSPGTLAPHSATDDRAIKMVKISNSLYFVEYGDNTPNIYLFLALIYFLLFGKNGIILNWDSSEKCKFQNSKCIQFPSVTL